jgi:hypothetical protein
MARKLSREMKESLKQIEKELAEVPDVDDPYFGIFLEWAVSYPEEAAKEYPRFNKRLADALSGSTAWEIATIYEAIVKHVSSWVEEANKTLSPSQRQRNLSSQLEILKSYKRLGEGSTSTIIKAAYIRHKEIFDEYITFVESELIENSIKNKEKHSHKKSKLSYVWQGDIKEVDILYDQLILKGFLSTSTDKENFKAIFEGIKLESIKPLQWLRNSNLLAYLIDKLNDNGKFPDNTNFWSIAEDCFKGVKNLKQQRINYQNNKSEKPKGFSAIDNILKAISC